MSTKNLDLGWFSDPRDESQLRRLTCEVDSLAVRKTLAPTEFEQLLGVFERFPEDDGYESFWSIIHCLESFHGYEPLLIQSVRRKPCEFNLTMVNRLLNAGVAEVQGEFLVDLLGEVASAATTEASVAAEAAHFLEYQKRRGSGA